MLDIRLPSSALFIVLGALLALYGAGLPQAQYAKAAGCNLDLWWGAVMGAFGLAMGAWHLVSKRLSAGQLEARVPPARTPSPTGRED